MGSGADIWTTPFIDTPATGERWRCLMVIGDAPASQFDLLHGLLRREAGIGPVACLALEGRDFHGHRGRSWAAEPGNIHLSVGLPVNLPPSGTLPLLIMLPAVAVVDAVREVTGGRVQPGIKWVNDILVEGRKIAGVLTTTQTRGALVEAVTLGIGLNVARAPVVAPTPFVPRTGALHDHIDGGKPGIFKVLTHLLAALQRRHGQLLAGEGEKILGRYRNSSLVLGQQVRVWDESQGEREAGERWPAPLAAGRVLSIEADLTLRIEGFDPPVSSGRLALESACRDILTGK